MFDREGFVLLGVFLRAGVVVGGRGGMVGVRFEVQSCFDVVDGRYVKGGNGAVVVEGLEGTLVFILVGKVLGFGGFVRVDMVGGSTIGGLKVRIIKSRVEFIGRLMGL